MYHDAEPQSPSQRMVFVQDPFKNAKAFQQQNPLNMSANLQK